MSWRTFVNLCLGFVVAGVIAGIFNDVYQNDSIHKLQRQNRIQQQMLFDLGCRTVDNTYGQQTYCSTRP